MTPRPSRKGDENALKALWREVFGDTDEYIDAFFQNVYQPSMASVIEEDGTVVAAAYAVPFGAVRYIFAVATRPEYRGRGYGRAVVFAAAGGEPVQRRDSQALLRYRGVFLRRARRYLRRGRRTGVRGTPRARRRRAVSHGAQRRGADLLGLSAGINPFWPLLTR